MTGLGEGPHRVPVPHCSSLFLGLGLSLRGPGLVGALAELEGVAATYRFSPWGCTGLLAASQAPQKNLGPQVSPALLTPHPPSAPLPSEAAAQAEPHARFCPPASGLCALQRCWRPASHIPHPCPGFLSPGRPSQHPFPAPSCCPGLHVGIPGVLPLTLSLDQGSEAHRPTGTGE